MWQNSRAERDKSILRRGNVFQPGRRGFFDPLPILTLLSPSVSLLSQLKLLPSAFWCALPQCFWAFVYLKKETFIYKESIKASSKKDYLKQCSLEKQNYHSDHMPAHQLIIFSLPLYSVLSDIFHAKHASLLNKWLSAFLASVHSGAPTVFLWNENAGWIMHCWMGQGDIMMSHSEAVCKGSGSQPRGRDPTKRPQNKFNGSWKYLVDREDEEKPYS